MDIETLKELVAARLSLEEIMDILGWGNVDLVEFLEDYIQEYAPEFIEAVSED